MRDIIYKNPCFNSFAMLYMKYDCSFKCISVILLQINILALSSNVLCSCTNNSITEIHLKTAVIFHIKHSEIIKTWIFTARQLC